MRLDMSEEPGDLDGPRFMSEQDVWDAELDALLGRNRSSRVDELEWELWDGVEQDAAEREMLRLTAPDWVLLPPGGDLASALEQTRPQALSPMALIELMKAANRLCGWAESIKASAMASFYRQRRAEHRESPRPTQLDASGRPIDAERSWYGEIGLALGWSANTVGPRVQTALRLTSTLSATHTALKCGALTWGKALAISEATSTLSDEAAQAVEAHVLKRAANQTHKNLQVSLRRQVAKHTIAEAAEAHRAAVAERTCKIVPLPDGMAGLWVVHTSDKIQQMWVVIQAMATLAKRTTPTPMNPTTNPTTTDARDRRSRNRQPRRPSTPRPPIPRPPTPRPPTPQPPTRAVDPATVDPADHRVHGRQSRQTPVSPDQPGTGRCRSRPQYDAPRRRLDRRRLPDGHPVQWTRHCCRSVRLLRTAAVLIAVMVLDMVAVPSSCWWSVWCRR